MNTNDFFKLFFDSTEYQCLSKHTQRDYLIIQKFFCAEFGLTKVNQIDSESILTYLERRHAKNAYISFNKEYSYLKAIFQRMLKLKLINSNPLFVISKRKPNRNKGEIDSAKVCRACTREQLRYLLSLLEENDYQSYLILCLLSESGCRSGEALSTRKTQLKIGHIYLPMTKNGSPRYICFSKKLGEMLFSYSSSHASEWLFPSVHDSKQHVTYNSFQKKFTKYAKDIIVQSTGKPLTIHGIRHTFASERVGLVDPLELKELMGHQSIQTTIRYISVSKEKILNAYEKTKHLSFV